jgi:hypothetical protein
MNRADEGALVWALTDSASTFLHEQARTRLCVKIGAAEQEVVIAELLRWYARHDVELSSSLAAEARSWTRGYTGSEYEPVLRSLVDRIRVSYSVGNQGDTTMSSISGHGRWHRLTASRRPGEAS